MIREALDPPAACPDEIGTDDRFVAPVTALGKHVGLRGADQLERRIFLEDRNVVHHLEGREHFGAFGLADDGPIGCLPEPANRGVAVEPDDQPIAEPACLA
jgi:hypothetical protein